MKTVVVGPWNPPDPLLRCLIEPLCCWLPSPGVWKHRKGLKMPLAAAETKLRSLGNSTSLSIMGLEVSGKAIQ